VLKEDYTLRRELLGSLALDSSGECYRGKLFPKPFHFNEGNFVEKPYEADLELPIAQASAVVITSPFHWRGRVKFLISI
jgi:hypothetical protein